MAADTVQIGDSVVSGEVAGDETTNNSPGIDSFKETKMLKWSQLDVTNAFTERVGHTLIWSEQAKKIYMLGGGNHEGDINEIWVLDYEKTGPLTWTAHKAVDDFDGRYEFAAALNSTEDKIWIFGGADFQLPRNDVCYLDLINETFVTKFAVNRELPLQSRNDDETRDYGVPYPRTQGGNSCLLELEGKSYLAVYGGGVKGEHAVPDGNLYLFDVDEGEWKRILVTGDTPGIRQGHVMTSVGTKIFLHGGMHEFSIYDDLYSIDLAEFSTKTPTWNKISSEIHPPGRAAQGLVKDGHDLYIFGGLGDEGALGDLWKFNTDSLEWTNLQTQKFPAPRLDAAMTLVRLGEGSDESGIPKKVLLVHGGMNTEGTLFKDFWVLALP